MKKAVTTLLVLGIWWSVALCVEPPEAKNLVDPASYLNIAAHDVADQLLRFGRRPPGRYIIGVTTFVDINYLEATTPFGRLFAELLVGELQRAGFKVIELRLTKDIMIEKALGELSLSREVKNIYPEVKLNAIVVGTYMVSGGYLYINARLVSKKDGQVLSTALKIMPLNPQLLSLLYPINTIPEPTVKVRIRAAR